MKPLQDRIIVRKASEEQKSLIVVVNDQPTQSVGYVVAVGDGYHLENGAVMPLDVQVGDRVIFPIHAGANVIVDGERLLIIKESEIYAILEDE